MMARYGTTPGRCSGCSVAIPWQSRRYRGKRGGGAGDPARGRCPRRRAGYTLPREDLLSRRLRRAAHARRPRLHRRVYRDLPTSLPAVPHLDKLGHAVLIGPIAFFLDGALNHRTLLRGHAFPRLAPVAVLIVAGVEEYLQRLSPRRTSDWADFLAERGRRVLLHVALAARGREERGPRSRAPKLTELRRLSQPCAKADETASSLAAVRHG